MFEDDSCPCDNYDKIYCEHCGKEIDHVNRTIARQSHGICECFFECSECENLCPICEQLNCTCLEELKEDFSPSEIISENLEELFGLDWDDFEI